jgi:hypothetical protein
LWKASVPVQDTATAATTSFNWTNSKLIATGYAGQTGATGPAGANGAAGTAGLSSRIAYTQTTLAALGSSPGTITTTGSTSYPPSGSWGAGTSWSGSPGVLSVGESLYQSDGIYNPATNATVWNIPYLSSLKVGSLSAITANMGTLTAGDITIGSAPTITSVSTMTGRGTHLYDNGGFAMGTATTNIVYRGNSGDKIYLNGDIVATGNLQANSVTQIQSGQDTTPRTFNYSTGGDSAAFKFRLPLQTYIDGTILNVFFTATKVDPGNGDIEVVFNILNAGDVLVGTFGGAPIGKRMVQTMGPTGDKVTATFTGSTQLVTGGQYKVEALVYNSYGGSWTSNRIELIVLGAKR